MPPEKPMIEARFTIAPPPRRFMYGMAVREQRNTAVKLRSTTASHSARESSVAGLRLARPALFTRRSMLPCSRSACAKAPATTRSSVTSLPVLTSKATTRAPCSAKSRAVAAPMPRAPPVTMATLPSSRKSIMGAPQYTQPRMHDFVFRGALLLDGLGGPPRRGDLAVADGMIAAVGEVDGAARETIDADSLALMPGIIDNHTHYDAQLTWDPWVAPSPALGVTTAIIGNCGFTIAPCRATDRELVMRNLTQVEGMSLEALRAGIRWEFETVPQYLDMLERREAWRPALALQGKDYERRLADPAFRVAVRAEIARPGHFRLFNGEWDKVQVVESRRRELEGRTIAELAAEAASDPLDCMLDLALAENLDTVFSALLLNSDEEAVARLLADPHALVSLSDAGAHLTFFNDAGYGLHLLGHWSRELGALSLEQAVWRLTGQPAALYGIKQRGVLREGYYADLLLFDPRTVERTPNRRVYDLPAGASRLTCDAIGVHGVWVNGERIVQANGVRASERLPGRLLRDFAA